MRSAVVSRLACKLKVNSASKFYNLSVYLNAIVSFIKSCRFQKKLYVPYLALATLLATLCNFDFSYH